MATKSTQKDSLSESAQPVEQDPVHKAITTDEYAGKGGSYIYDPATGKRTPVPEPSE